MLERPAAARAAGFDGAEILFPYDLNAAELGRSLSRARLPLALINCPPPNYADPAGPRGFAATPGGQERFRHDFRRARRYAKALGAERIHLMAGAAMGPEAREAFVENLRWAAEFAPEQELTIEPINTADMPGYFLADLSLALSVMAEVGAMNLSLQFDAYHLHRIAGDVTGAWDAVHPHVGHVQISDHPGRNEPGTGDIDFAAFFARLKATGYKGWIGAEYTPHGTTDAGLGWMASAR